MDSLNFMDFIFLLSENDFCSRISKHFTHIYLMFTRVRNRFLRYLLILIYSIVLITCAVQLNFLGLFGYSPTRADIIMPTLNVASEVYTAEDRKSTRLNSSHVK